MINADTKIEWMMSVPSRHLLGSATRIHLSSHIWPLLFKFDLEPRRRRHLATRGTLVAPGSILSVKWAVKLEFDYFIFFITLVETVNQLCWWVTRRERRKRRGKQHCGGARGRRRRWRERKEDLEGAPSPSAVTWKEWLWYRFRVVLPPCLSSLPLQSKNVDFILLLLWLLLFLSTHRSINRISILAIEQLTQKSSNLCKHPPSKLLN